MNDVKTYELQVAGLTRHLPLCPIDDQTAIAAFIMFSDVELTVACATELLKKAPECDVILTAEAKGIPLAYEMSRQSGIKYILARKSVKLYMHNPVGVDVKSITTTRMQTLYLDQHDLEYLSGRRVLVVDDVISSGESLHALEELVRKAGGSIVGRAAVLAEGDAAKRDDILFLEPLPVFTKE